MVVFGSVDNWMVAVFWMHTEIICSDRKEMLLGDVRSKYMLYRWPWKVMVDL